MILYLDTSALIKLFVREAGTDEVQSACAEAAVLVTSGLTYVETYSAFARMRADDRLSTGGYEERIASFRAFWTQLATVAVDEVLGRAATLTSAHRRLRAYDAVHLASAVSLRAEQLEFACWDSRLRAAAAVERLSLQPSAL